MNETAEKIYAFKNETDSGRKIHVDFVQEVLSIRLMSLTYKEMSNHDDGEM